MTEEEYFEQIAKEDKGIDLIVITYYRWELTKQCLDYLFQRTKTPYRLTVVDNGSKDITPSYLLNLKAKGKIGNLILLDRNYGLEYARNTALRHIHSKYCVFFDNDLLCPDLEPDWLSRLQDLMEKNSEYGCIALRPQVLVGAVEKDASQEVIENNHVGATFMMFRTDLLKDVKWDDKFTNRVADWRMGDLLKEKGLKMGWARDIRCHHIFGKNWSYPKEVEHFHREIWPPAEHYDNIKTDPKTLKPI